MADMSDAESHAAKSEESADADESSCVHCEQQFGQPDEDHYDSEIVRLFLRYFSIYNITMTITYITDNTTVVLQ